jgi:hypothetical protein
MSTSTHLWLLPALAISMALAPAFAAQQSRPSDGAAPCYRPPIRPATKTPMSALRPGGCHGVEDKAGSPPHYCYSCGRGEKLVGHLFLYCVSCRTGYSWTGGDNERGQCCRQGVLGPPQQK